MCDMLESVNRFVRERHREHPSNIFVIRLGGRGIQSGRFTR
jgi:hypothetical protein